MKRKIQILLLPIILLLLGCTAPVTDTVTADGENGEGLASFPTHEGYRIYVLDQTGWSAISLYMYGTQNDLGGSWPGISVGGTLQRQDGTTYKYFNVPSQARGCTEKLIFNNSGGGSQLKDEPSVTFDRKADYFFKVTADKATAFDGGSTLEVEVDDSPVKASAVKICTLEESERNAWHIYQVNPRLYGSSGVYGKIQDRLDKIQALGCNVLYLMPIYLPGKTKSIGSPYCIKDFKALNTAYGSADELRSLIGAAHAKGMKVMLDWVANHTAWDCAWITEHKDWYAQDATGNIVCPTADGTWTDVAQLNYESAALRQAMEDAMLYWIDEFDIDGLRCDYAHGPTGSKTGPMDAFWKDAIDKLRERKDGLIMLAESDFDKMFTDGFDIIYSRQAKSSLVSVFAGQDPSAFFNTYQRLLAKAPAPKTTLLYITNHDDASEASPVSEFRGKDGALAAFVLMRSLNMSTMIYGSQEIAYDKPINFFSTLSLDWTANQDYYTSYSNIISQLGGYYHSWSSTVYSAGPVVMVDYGSNYVLVNTGSTAVEATLPTGKVWAAQPYEYKVVYLEE